MGKYIKKFNSLQAATSAENLVSPHISHIDQDQQSRLMMINCGNDQTIKIVGNSINDLDIACIISGEWTTKTTNKTKVIISGEVTLTSKVDCYSIEFLSGGHLTINGGARLRIWEGGIVNNDCETVNYFLIQSRKRLNDDFYLNICGEIGELLLHPNVITNIHPLGTYKLLIMSSLKENEPLGSQNLYFQHISLNNAWDSLDRTWNTGMYINKWNVKSGWENIIGLQNMKSDNILYSIAANVLYGGSDNIMTLTGKMNLNQNVSYNFSQQGYFGVNNPFLGKISTSKYFNNFSNNINYFDIFNEIYKNLTLNIKIASLSAFLVFIDSAKTITLNYKDLVWDPSFEEEVQAPLLTTMSAPMMTTSSTSANDGMPMPAASSMIEGEPIFED